MENFKRPNIPGVDDETPETPSWKERAINLENHYPEPEFILEFNGSKFFTIGDVVVIKGKPKKGKSHLMLSFIVALMSGQYIGMNRMKEQTKILYIDAEMHPNYTALLTRKIHKAVGINPLQNSAELTVLNLKRDAPAERERIIEEAIQDLQPYIVFIDGVKDITRTEPNDQAEGKRIGEELKQWSGKYNCLIVVAIHENKNDMNSRGAVGSAVEEISSEVWRIDRDIEGLFTASQTLFRYHSPVKDLCFTMDDEGNIQKAEPPERMSNAERKLQSMNFLFSEIFSNFKQLSYTNLEKEYMRVKKVKNTAAFNGITYAFENKIIAKDLVGDYVFNNLIIE